MAVGVCKGGVSKQKLSEVRLRQFKSKRVKK